MSKGTEEFVKEAKTLPKKLKELSQADPGKLKKSVMTNLEKTWAAEDRLKEVIQEVKETGVALKKPVDFLKRSEVGKPLKAWQEALKKHHSGLADYFKARDAAGALHTTLTKSLKIAEADLKKKGGASDPEATQKAVKDAKAALPALKKASASAGDLQSHVVLYGTNLARTMEAIAKQAIAEVTPVEFPKPLADENRPKTEKKLKKDAKILSGLGKLVNKALEANDIKKANILIKKADVVLKGLKPLAKEAKATETKMKKEVKENVDAKAINALIKKMIDTHNTGEELFKKFKKDVEAKGAESKA